MVSLLSPGLPPLSLQDILDNAGRLVDRHLQEDSLYLDLVNLLNIPAENQPSLSGLHDHDYPSLPEVGVGLEALSELLVEKRVPLPPELVEQFGRMQCNCMMGLFPEIERAWLTIDSDIFVWKYEDGSDLAYFDGLSETILSAALVKPKPGIFQPHIQYLMCLATPVDIILLGVSFYRSQDGGSGDFLGEEMHLLPDPPFSIPTDGVYITSIVGADNGRIFMAGKDGCLYEMIYQAENGWFSRKCRKVNHSTSSLSFLIPSFLNFSFSEDDPLVQISIDNSRGILYARTQKGTIQVFDLGEDSKGMGRIASQSQASIMSVAGNVARNIEKSHFKSIVYIAAVAESESEAVNLVAVTESGVRLYFTTAPFKQSSRRPSTLSLVHVRLPPGFSATSTPQPANVHTAFHSKGTLLLVASQAKDNDLLWTISSDSFPFHKQLMEAHTTLPVGGKTWAIDEVTFRSQPQRQLTVGGKRSPIEPPSVVTQHALPPRRFVILSAQGVHILQKLRPVEQLKMLMIECGGPDAEQVKAFFRLHKIDQACATCLVLACSRSTADQEVCDWARMAFFMYGGEAQYNFSGIRPPGLHNTSFGAGPGGLSSTVMYSPGSMGTSLMPGSPVHNAPPLHMSTPAPGMLAQMPQTMGQGSSPGQDVMYSGKHNGIYICLSRILRPFWDFPVCTEFVCATKQGTVTYLTSTFNTEELCVALKLVRDLSDFVDFNSKFDLDSQADTMNMGRGGRFDGGMDEHTRKCLQAEVQRMEKISLQHVQELLHRVEEVLGLWRVLIDHQFHTLAATMTQELQNQLRAMTLKTLVIGGKEMCNTLVNCLISRYLDDNATVDAISAKLREVCPNLYSTDDATCSKSNELLQAAKVNQNMLEKQHQLQEALSRLKAVNQPLNLSVICSQLASVHFYLGIVELGLNEARKVDPQQLAIHFYQNGEPQEDIQGMQGYLARMECYKCITDTLSYLWSASVSHPQAPSVPSQPGPPATADSRLMDPQQAEVYKEEVFQAALRCEDPLFHAALYDWLFATNHAEKLLEVNTPYVEQYLRRKVNLQTDNTSALDMLWKHYEKTENFPAATRILAQLAERQGSNINLTQRLEYLSRAVICAKSSTSRLGTSASGEFLHELEEKMEVARLQMQVYKCLSNMRNSHDVEAAKNRLDSELLDITSLYEDFADRFDLHEVKLAIVHCAGLYDAALIENLWQNIICKEIGNTAQMPQGDRITSVSNRLCAIAKLYINAERYFPVALILRYMEQKSCELGLDHRWVFLLLLEVGVAPARLLELYDRLYKSKDIIWQNHHKPLHVLTVLQAFIDHLANKPSYIPASDRRRLVMTCLDSVASYLVELQAISSTDPQVRSLTASFKVTQAKLDRL
ncbi:nuclear pore complex protein Nup155 [Aplysia californica]|uniref:Nuclear pore complex protein Nup155 n=1 Tax=Aplysia californica TaxID=6500 RepID=A0ABM0JZF1_APLCA|nr:nuclear pore complex protein Nup155 [Aplysia californica]XP_012941740.1 nuclear pore complex protein Nup155 [Aplysia californica]XP_012941741.1 nuclear pore complex protein Nup155 [Aplysia californica]